MIRLLTAIFFIVFLVMPPVALAQGEQPATLFPPGQINPNQVARGSAYTTTNIATAISFCGVRTACEWHINAVANVMTSQTLPANMRPVFEGGGQINLQSGAVLTVAGGIVSAPPGAQVFTGPGTVNGLTRVLPEWFGGTYTLDQLVATLQDVPHATIGPWRGAMLTSGSLITRGHLAIQGSGLLPYTADHSGYSGPGSIIQGKILLNIPDLQVDGVVSDMGSYQATHGGYCTGDASGNFLDIAPTGNTPSTISIRHFATLGCNAGTAAHSVLVENFDGVILEDIHTWFNTRGVVSKSSHVSGSDIFVNENAGEAFIIKSDSTEGGGPVTANHFRNVQCVNASPATGGEVNFFADQALLSDITVDGLTMINEGVLDIEGYAVPNGTPISAVNISNLYNVGSSGRGVYLGAYMGNINLLNPVVLNPASDAIWFVGGPVNIVNPLIVNPGSHVGIVEVNGGSGSVTGGRCIGSTTACILSNNGPVLVSNVFSEYPLAAGGGIQSLGSPLTANGNFMVGTSTDLTNYYFGNGDVRQDKSIGVSGFNSAQINLQNTGSSMANQHRFQAVLAESGFSMSFLNDAGLSPVQFFGCTRAGTTTTGCSIGAPLSIPSIAPANGFTGSKTAGACLFTITAGIITAVSGC